MFIGDALPVQHSINSLFSSVSPSSCSLEGNQNLLILTLFGYFVPPSFVPPCPSYQQSAITKEMKN